MRIIYDPEEVAESRRTSVVTVGNFDGVHLAHQQLFRRVVATARPLGAMALAVTFEPHPARVLSRESTPQLLTALPQKIRLIERAGLDALLVLPFTEAFAQLSPQQFVHEILVERLRVAAVHVGQNFRFGHGRVGDIDLLRNLAQAPAFRVDVLPTLIIRGETVSSSRIRGLLAEGRVGTACRLLDRPYSVEGRIVPGRSRGRQETVPTLNLAPIDELLPQPGVYVTRTRLGTRTLESVTNVGTRPTFGADALTVETHLLGFSGEIKEAQMAIEFLHRLRDEIKFASALHLRAQIEKDVARALKLFRLLSRQKQSVSPGAAPARIPG